MTKSRTPVFITSWSSGLDAMKRRDQRYPDKVLQQLERSPRFSVFEATENATISKTMDWLVKEKLIEVDNESVGYPWSIAKITTKGYALMRSHPRAA